MAFCRNTGCSPTTFRSILRRVIIIGGVSLAMLFPVDASSVSTAFAQDVPESTGDPFEYSWEVLFRKKSIGYSLSRFRYIIHDDEQRLCADGYRSFTFEAGPVSLRITEQTRAVWDDRGRICELEARTAVGGDVTLTHVLRTTEGVSIVKETERKEKEYFFAHDEYDHTEVGRFLHILDFQDGEETLRILSITEEKVKKISYEFLGVCDYEVDGKDLACSRIGFDGPKSTGEMLVDELGIPVLFDMDTPLGPFTFIPCDPDVAKDTLFSEEMDFFEYP